MIADNSNGKPSQYAQPNSPLEFAPERFSRIENEEDGANGLKMLSKLWNAWRRYWLIATPFSVCLAALCMVVVWKLWVPKFTASAFLKIDADDRPLIFKTADEQASRGVAYDLYRNTQKQLLSTPFVLIAALRDPKLAAMAEVAEQEDPSAWLKENIKVDFPANSEIMQVVSETPRAELSIAIVNAVVSAYMQEVVVNDRNDRLGRLNNLERVYSEAEGKIRSKQAELKTLASALGTSDSESLAAAQELSLKQFGQIQEKLGTIQLELIQVEGDLAIAESRNSARDLPEGATPSAADENSAREKEIDLTLAERSPEVIRLEEEIEVLRAKIKFQSDTFGPRHLANAQLQTELDVKQKLLASRKEELRSRANMIAERGGGSLGPRELRARAESLKNQEKILQEKYNQLADETKKLGRSSIDVELLRSEIEGLEEVMSRVGAEIERTSIELKTASRIKLLNEATSAVPTDISKLFMRMGAAGVAGFGFPLFIALVWDLTRKRVNDLDGVRESLELPSMGMIPMVPKKVLRLSGEAAPAEIEPVRSQLDEAVKGLSSMILFCTQSEDKKVFMLSSAMPSEGKSTVSCLLSASLVKSGKKVALIDFDLRRPSIHNYLHLDLAPGVADVLNGSLTLSQVRKKMRSDEYSALDVYTAGDWDGDLRAKCLNGEVQEIFDELRAAYDIVIVDGCPVLPVYDTRVIGKYTDGVIFCLLKDRSRLPLASQACDILRSYSIPVIGTVFIGQGYSRYSGYYQYSSYYYTKGGK